MARSREEQNELNKATAKELRRELGIKTREEINDNLYREFITKATLVHGSKYDYSVRDSIGCPDHGPFSQSRSAHLRGQGCPQCGHESRLESNRVRTEVAAKEFVDKSLAVHGDMYDYSPTIYASVHSKIRIGCKVHGEFDQTPAAHLRGQGCPHCANERRASFAESNGEKAVGAWLDRHNIEYVKQKTFDDCRDRMILRFDFYLPEHNMLIEFDGQQHFVFVKKFHGTLDRFFQCQERDKIKTDYAENNGIRLLRIKYSEEKEIDNILSESIIR